MEKIVDLINLALVPLRLVVPQPILRKLPVLRTNLEERTRVVIAEYEGNVLDIGCGTNVPIEQYRSMGNKGEGVDVYPWKDDIIIVKDTACLPFESVEFDTVSFVACINHIPNRNDVLKESNRVLKHNGELLVTNLTPLISIVWHKIAFWDDDQHERGMKEGEVWGLTDSALRKITDEAGFSLVERKRFMWGLNNLYVFRKSREVADRRIDGPELPGNNPGDVP